MTPARGPIGRLGAYAATHFRTVAIAWTIIALGLGFLAPRVEHALSGAGWEATGSESLEAREKADASFGGLSSSSLMVVIHSDGPAFGTAPFREAIADARGTLEADPRIGSVIPPRPGSSVSPDGRTAVIQATAAADGSGKDGGGEAHRGMLRSLSSVGRAGRRRCGRVPSGHSADGIPLPMENPAST